MGKLCTDQLAKRLATLFKDINAAWQKVKEQAENEVKTQSFDQQVKTLLKKGYPNAAGMEESQFLKYINPLEENFRAGSVIVIPEIFVSITKKLALIGGSTPLDITKICNADGIIPRKPYLIHDIENGEAMMGISPGNCVKQFKREERHGFTVNEGVMYITYHTQTLQDHYMDFPGSWYGHSGLVAGLGLYGGRPLLVWLYAASLNSGWGSASRGI